MTEAQASQEVQMPRMQVLTQFVRDMSFENIAAQKSVTGKLDPQANVQVGLDAKKRGDDIYEIIHKISVTATSGEQTLFILEVEYAGIFKVENISDEHLLPYLMVECPRMLFPYIRRIVSDVSRDGGFAGFNIEPIDYLALYRSQAMQNQAANASAEGAGERASN